MSAYEKPPLSEETKKLAGQVLLILGAALIFVLFAWIIVPSLRRGPEEPKAGAGQEASTTPSSGWLDPAEAPARRGIEIPPVDPKEALAPSPAMLERGKVLFTRNCTACHGPLGHGDGPAAGGLNPKPRNFANPEGWTNGSRITDIYKTLQAGVVGTGMASYDYLPAKDRMALVHYVRSLGAFGHGQEDTAALAALGNMLASKGERTPNKIPVSLAMEKLAAEAAAAASLRAPEAADVSPGALLFRRVVADPARAARFLAGVPTWRTGLSAFAKTVAAGAPANGFNADVGSLTTAQWRDLQAGMAGRETH